MLNRPNRIRARVQTALVAFVALFSFVALITGVKQASGRALLVIRVTDTGGKNLPKVQVFIDGKLTGKTGRDGSLEQVAGGGKMTIILKKERYETVTFTHYCAGGSVCDVPTKAMGRLRVDLIVKTNPMAKGTPVWITTPGTRPSSRARGHAAFYLAPIKVGTVNALGQLKTRVLPSRYRVSLETKSFATQAQIANVDVATTVTIPAKLLSVVIPANLPSHTVLCFRNTRYPVPLKCVDNAKSGDILSAELLFGKYVITGSLMGIHTVQLTETALDANNGLAPMQRTIESRLTGDQLPAIKESRSLQKPIYRYRYGMKIFLAIFFSLLTLALVFGGTFWFLRKKSMDAQGQKLDRLLREIGG